MNVIAVKPEVFGVPGDLFGISIKYRLTREEAEHLERLGMEATSGRRIKSVRAGTLILEAGLGLANDPVARGVYRILSDALADLMTAAGLRLVGQERDGNVLKLQARAPDSKHCDYDVAFTVEDGDAVVTVFGRGECSLWLVEAAEKVLVAGQGF